MSDKKAKFPQTTLPNLSYYFDALQRDYQDQAALCRKSGEWLGVRQKLLKLPDEVYEVTMAAILSLVHVGLEQSERNDGPNKPKTSQQKEAAQALFDKTRHSLQKN